MKTFTISQLARTCGLSRSTLLYYDRLGLLRASARAGSGYRLYTLREQERLARIRHFRDAGLRLSEIRAVLDSGGRPGVRLLERRIRETASDLTALKRRQRLLTGMLRKAAAGKPPVSVDKRMWVAMLRAAGMDDRAMRRWHREFEQRAPEGHQEFLEALGIPADEAVEIRRQSRLPG